MKIAPRPSQNGERGSRHGSWGASGFHHGDSGFGPDGPTRSPGAGANPSAASGYLWKYAEQVGPAVKGAVTHPGGAAEKECYADS